MLFRSFLVWSSSLNKLKINEHLTGLVDRVVQKSFAPFPHLPSRWICNGSNVFSPNNHGRYRQRRGRVCGHSETFRSAYVSSILSPEDIVVTSATLAPVRYQYSTCDPVRNAIAALPNLINHENITVLSARTFDVLCS